jgi:hypothetical protein
LLYAHENRQCKVAWSSSLPSALELFIACAHVTLAIPNTSDISYFPPRTSPHRPQIPKPPTSQTFSRKHPTSSSISRPAHSPNPIQTHTHTSCSAVRNPISKSVGGAELTASAAPPQPSKRELEAAEAQTMTDIKWTAASVVVLYFCEFGWN